MRRCAFATALSISNTAPRQARETERVKLKIDIDDRLPCAILFDGRGEFMTGEAVRWCARRGICLILPDGPGRMVTIAHSALEAAEGETLRDVGPAIIRAQCAADPVQVAREIVRAKIATEAAGLAPALRGEALTLPDTKRS